MTAPIQRPQAKSPPASQLEPSESPPPAVPAPTPKVAAMPTWRVALVLIVLAIIVGGHAYEAKTQKEHWPFSPYQMWSIATTDWNLTDHRFYGVTDEPTPREILLNDPTYFYPLPSRFMRLHLIQGLNEMKKELEKRETDKKAGKDISTLPPVESPHLNAIMPDYLKRYEERRKAGLHNGPSLKGVRVYEFHWLMDRDATNVDKPELQLWYESPSVKGIKTAGPLAGDNKKGGGDVGLD